MDLAGSSEKAALDAIADALGIIPKLKAAHTGLTDLFVNPDGGVFIEVMGKDIDISKEWQMPPARRESLIRRLAGYYGLIVSEENPSLSIRLPVHGGGRFQGHIPPVVDAPGFTIRFPSTLTLSLQDLVNREMMTEDEMVFLSQAVMDHKNIIVAGSTGSGKTTVVSALLQLVKTERVILVEDNPEIRLNTPNKYEMRTSRYFALKDALFDTLRLTPTRIIIGEIRDGKTADQTLKNWATGHPGGLGTLHASSADGVLRRLYELVAEEVIKPSSSTIKEAVNIVVFVEKVRKDDGRVMRQITEIKVVENDGKEIV